MYKKNFLCGLEYIILLMLQNRDMYGLEIFEFINSNIKKDIISLCSVYASLHSLLKKEYVSSYIIQHDKKGRPYIYFKIEEKGKNSLKEFEKYVEILKLNL